MPHEKLPQPTPDEAHEQNHAELVEVMGQLQVGINSNYRNDRPRSPEQIGKQEELLAMLQAVLKFART